MRQPYGVTSRGRWKPRVSNAPSAPNPARSSRSTAGHGASALFSREYFALARDQHWYRIPVSSVEKWLKGRWPPRWLAFYQTKVFGSDAFAVNYYCQVLDVREVRRWQLFPDQPRDDKGLRRYHQLLLGPLQRLPRPIVSRRWRRIVFIPTTWRKFASAAEINDLYDDSPLEDRLWAELKRLGIRAERQEFVAVGGRNYALDFAALRCEPGQDGRGRGVCRWEPG